MTKLSDSSFRENVSWCRAEGSSSSGGADEQDDAEVILGEDVELEDGTEAEDEQRRQERHRRLSVAHASNSQKFEIAD